MVSTGLWAYQPIGTPFFRNYPSSVYNAHNRNFDVMCDDEGYVYVANFEGLLIYDNVIWRVIHTPGISRVLSLSKDEKGRVWFSGINVKGCIEEIVGDSVKVHYTESDKYASKEPATLGYGYENIDRWNGIEVHKRVKISDNRILLATATDGVIAIDSTGNKVWEINEDKGLCSNSITTIDYDQHGTVWGATDNGIFSISTTEIYTKFGIGEGLHGQVTCIRETQGKLFVGTFQGLFCLEGNHFEKLPGMNQACWELDETAKNTVIAATTNGVFTYDGVLHKHSDKLSLTVMIESDNSYLSGELDGIYRRWYDGRSQLVDSIANVVDIEKDERGGVWALTLGGEHYYKPARKDHFVRQNNGMLSLLMVYTDENGNHWHSKSDGMGLVMDSMSEKEAMWLRPFDSYNIQSLYVHDGVVWVGGNFGLIRYDMDGSKKVKPEKPTVYMRDLMMHDKRLLFNIANDVVDALGETLYSFRLHDTDPWSRWDTDNDIILHNLAYGRYQLKVRSRDPFGQVSESGEVEFEIPYPIFMRWYALLMYFLLVILIVSAIFKYRTRMLQHKKKQLEAIVTERTQEVVQQKDEIEQQKNEIEVQKNEIEEKSNRLETTLKELRDAQHELLRKEHEATVGKLTKGLIDRILNPMNYINNFSHLTLGLARDIKKNIEEEEKKMDEEVYEDCMDVLGMMTQNLEKIEQHGISTTRTLKAMEELLRERMVKIETIDVAMLIAQGVEMAQKYYNEQIRKYNISFEWKKPELPIVADLNPEFMSKVITSLLGNSVYAVVKKAERMLQSGEKYDPIIRVVIWPHSGEKPPFIEFYDNGVGIEKEVIDKIFDPFFTTKPTLEASGIGLYLSQQIIQDFGGSIIVDSEKNKYTKFIISLP